MNKQTYLFCKFLQVEIHKIDEDKWYEGERKCCDPGQEFIFDWIRKNAANWRKEWFTSKCQHCKFWKVCGHQVRKVCTDYEFDSTESQESIDDDIVKPENLYPD